MTKEQRAELIVVITRLMTADGSESELDALLHQLETSVPHPGVSDLVFFPEKPMSAEEVLEKALAYRPIVL